jgi:quinoprotein glucose dehydrogenase
MLWRLLVRKDRFTQASTRWHRFDVYPAAGDRYSSLTQIDRHNVVVLKEAWRYETGEGGLQTSPLMVNGMLYWAY